MGCNNNDDDDDDDDVVMVLFGSGGIGTNTVIRQSSGGKTLLKFTQPLNDENDDVVIQAGKPVRYIWAQGLSNVLGYHVSRGVGSTILANCTTAA
jgi:hypothetical protein